MDPATIYGPAHRRIVDLVRSLSDEELARRVPACPAWTVRDLVAHLAGVAADTVAANFEGAPGDAWTAKQIEARRDLGVDAILEEWAPNAAKLAEALPVPQPAFDAITHEWDLRGATGRAGDREDPDIATVVEQVTSFIDGRLRKRDGPALRIVAGTDEFVLGPGTDEPPATLTIEPYELFRLGFGRRSVAQVHAYDWSGDPEPYVRVLSVFPYATEDLTEP